MNEFLKKVLTLGGELEKATDGIHINMIINDAEKLYLEHTVELQREINKLRYENNTLNIRNTKMK